MRKGRKQKVKTGAEMDWLYAKRLYCFLKNGKAVRKLKKQMNRRWRRERNDEMLEEVNEDICSDYVPMGLERVPQLC